MMKIGERFKDKTTGKVYIIRMEIGNDTLFLEGENGLGRRLTGKQSLKRTCEKLENIASWSRYISYQDDGFLIYLSPFILYFSIMLCPMPFNDEEREKDGKKEISAIM